MSPTPARCCASNRWPSSRPPCALKQSESRAGSPQDPPRTTSRATVTDEAAQGKHAKVGLADAVDALRAELTPLGYSSGQPTTCLLHRWQRRLRPRQRPRTDVNRRRLSRDRDVLSRRRVTTLVRLLSGPDAHRQLHQPQLANPNLLRVPELIEHDVIQRRGAPASRLALLSCARSARASCACVRATTSSQVEPRP